VLWFLGDNQNTTRDLIDHTGDAGEHYAYTPFGAVLPGSDTSITRYLYTGREYDWITELQYNRNRWYAPALQRWMSQDPIGFAGGDSNLYRYVANASTLHIDPSGLMHEGTFTFLFSSLGGGNISESTMVYDADRLVSAPAWKVKGIHPCKVALYQIASTTAVWKLAGIDKSKSTIHYDPVSDGSGGGMQASDWVLEAGSFLQNWQSARALQMEITLQYGMTLVYQT